jgi:hypothetical protein
MDLASAYPNSAISTGAMLAIALVAAGSLALWLVLVFRADRARPGQSARRAQQPPAALAGPDLTGPVETAEDEQDEAGHGDAARQRQAAA